MLTRFVTILVLSGYIGFYSQIVSAAGLAPLSVQAHWAHDIVRLDISKIATDHVPWVEGQTMPGPYSGSDIMERNPNAHTSPSQSYKLKRKAHDYGEITVISVLNSKRVPHVVHYDWLSYDYSLNTETLDQYMLDVFHNSGRALFPLSLRKNILSSRPAELFYLPASYLSDLHEAIRYVQAHASAYPLVQYSQDLLSPEIRSTTDEASTGLSSENELGDKELKFLRTNLTNKNKALAIESFRVLLYSDQCDPSDLQSLLHHSDIIQQAALTFAILEHLNSADQRNCTEGLLDYIENATNDDQIAGIAVGVLTAQEVASYEDIPKSLEFGNTLLSAVNGRSLRFGFHLPSNKLIKRVVELSRTP